MWSVFEGERLPTALSCGWAGQVLAPLPEDMRAPRDRSVPGVKVLLTPALSLPFRGRTTLLRATPAPHIPHINPDGSLTCFDCQMMTRNKHSYEPLGWAESLESGAGGAPPERPSRRDWTDANTCSRVERGSTASHPHWCYSPLADWWSRASSFFVPAATPFPHFPVPVSSLRDQSIPHQRPAPLQRGACFHPSIVAT